MNELQRKHRRDYREPDYWIREVELRFDLRESETIVSARLQCERHAEAASDAPLTLDGERLELLEVSLDGAPLNKDRYSASPEQLTIEAPGESFVLETRVRIHPQDNTSMEGLYQSSGNYCTQCEAEGFRRITYFLDRPDVMARYTTTIEADRERYPVMLSNGNCVDRGAADDGRHWTKWRDPFPKPSYLFALVAGQLASHRRSFQTASGRTVELEIWVEPQNIDACEHALASLEKSMRWDEQTFGLEYDLDLYMIVAVGDFNMGAMENKGLNIFNTKYVLAKPETATDTDFEQIERVVAHEYFHNWTGNRVTCRDWFQLTLKEGLTVFRDQLFSADMRSPAVNRIRDVRTLRTRQFAEDEGPMAHPIRPESYVEMNNFYTVTVYNKGAEVIRMVHTMLGSEGFRRGMDLYFQRHDGSAVECDDFLAAMADANELDLKQFERWYSQAGTPVVEARCEYEAASRTCTLKLRQSCRETPGLPAPQPLHMPIRTALVGPDGEDMQVSVDGVKAGEHVLHLRHEEQEFCFENVDAEPVVSLLRGFSAPVRLAIDRSDEELAFLFANDNDPFTRWDSGQSLAERVLAEMIRQIQQGRQPTVGPLLIDAVEQVLASSLDGAMKSLAVVLPDEVWLGQQMDVVDVDAAHAARESARREIASRLRQRWIDTYERLQDEPYVDSPESAAKRSLKNTALTYLCRLEEPEFAERAEAQLERADNMTDAQAALRCLTDTDCRQREPALESFYQRWRHEPLVMDKWFAIQATSARDGVVDDVRRLAGHPDYHEENPNRVRSLLGAFSANQVHFHRADGAGYALLADHVLQLDGLNPQMAAGLVSSFNSWRRFDATRQALIREQLQRIIARPNLSKDVGEIVERSLEA